MRRSTSLTQHHKVEDNIKRNRKLCVLSLALRKLRWQISATKEVERFALSDRSNETIDRRQIAQLASRPAERIAIVGLSVRMENGYRSQLRHIRKSPSR